MTKREFLRATSGCGLSLPVRAELWRKMRSGVVWKYGIADFLLNKGFHRAEMVTCCEGCGPEYVEFQRTPNSKEHCLHLHYDIPSVVPRVGKTIRRES